MTVKIEEATREQVAVFLPGLIGKALKSYQEFMDAGPESEEEPAEKDSKSVRRSRNKVFIEHHNAGKVALAHIQLLLKLAQWANIKPDVSESEMQALMIRVKQSVDEARDKGFMDEFEDQDQ